MASVGSTKFRFHLQIKIRPPLYLHGVHFLTECFPFGYLMPQPPFKGMFWPFFVDLECVEIYTDDLSVFGNSFQESLKSIEKVLIHCQEAHLAFSDKKCRLMCKARVFLGHLVSNKGIQVDQTKIEVILHLIAPKTQREVRRFLGHACYYRRFIENFSRIVTPIFLLLAKDSEFLWSTVCKQPFETLKEKLVQPPVLRRPNQSLPFRISSNASVTTIGIALG